MKITDKVFSIAVALASAQVAYSHQLFPLGQPVNRIDGLIKSFCLLESTSVQESKACLETIKAWSVEEVVATCADEQAKALAESPGVTYGNMVEGGVWHRAYHKDKDGTDHRLDWSDGMRDEAGRRLGTLYVVYFRKNPGDLGIHTSTFKSRGAGFEAYLEGLVSSTRETSPGSSQKWTQKGLSQDEIDEEFARGYKEGYKDPQRAGITPNVCCEKGQPTCYSSNGNLKNEHPRSDPPPATEPEQVPPRVSSDELTKPVDTKKADLPNFSKQLKSDSDKVKKPETVVSSVADDEVIKHSPVQICIAKAMEKKFGNKGLEARLIRDKQRSQK
ncbi:MAG TPA: hypothetical protein VFO10_15915 [Oligoflexus sp.]|uniref:hypothetical protein n=1 Tax=Oligoflexus sp. TaxID=1971216 RepID=UPI002D7F9EB9|nr:hypothetical protein [Oligoflexus sp.]HET9238747.1 hypothetical protein [Oligoflexus sp.]